MWRGGRRSDISASAPFVWWCLSGPTMAPFPHPAHRTGRADFPHPACMGLSLSRYHAIFVGLRIVLFEICSAFTFVAACTLALSPIRDTHSEGFSQFATFLAAPVASGWSDCQVGLAPTGKRRLVTAHTHCGHSGQAQADGSMHGRISNMPQLVRIAHHINCDNLAIVDL